MDGDGDDDECAGRCCGHVERVPLACIDWAGCNRRMCRLAGPPHIVCCSPVVPLMTIFGVDSLML